MNRASKLYHAGTLTYTKGALAILCLWLLWGDFCFILMETVVPSIMPIKFDAIGAPDAIIGLVITTIPAILNTALNPVISVKSDRCRSRWGRRIPFIVVTLPFLVLCLVGLAFSEKIGFGLRLYFPAILGRFPAATVSIFVMGVMMTLFSFFNTFVNSVFWYLFNDVVPEPLMARFMSWFRMASLGAAAFYNLFIFQFAGTHSAAILCGIGALYFVGFGLMCLNVKEGEYPPPEEYIGGEVGFIAAVKTYARECLGVPHYWYLFLANIGMAVAAASSVFSIFLTHGSLGLTYAMVGRLAFASSLAGAVYIPLSGWLADRWHPIRVVLLGAILQVVLMPVWLVWLVWHPDSTATFYVMLALNICVAAPISSLVSVLDPVLAMRIYPRDRYGQFCSANAMLRSMGAIVAGVTVGVYIGVLKRHLGPAIAYRCLPLWNLAAALLVLFSVIKLYGSWRRHGGDTAYEPPGPILREPLDAVTPANISAGV